MAPFAKLIRFEATDSKEYFADIGAEAIELPVAGVELSASTSMDSLISRSDLAQAQVHRVRNSFCWPCFRLNKASYVGRWLTNFDFQLLAPLPYEGVPIYCVGLNFRSHAEEASVSGPIMTASSCFHTAPRGLISDKGRLADQHSCKFRLTHRSGRSPPLLWRIRASTYRSMISAPKVSSTTR